MSIDYQQPPNSKCTCWWVPQKVNFQHLLKNQLPPLNYYLVQSDSLKHFHAVCAKELSWHK